jgi:dGTPase
MSYVRGKAIGSVVYAAASVFVKHENELLAGNFAGSLLSKCEKPIINALARAKTVAKEKVFNHPRKIEIEIGSYTTIGILLRTFCEAAKERVEGKTVSFKGQRAIDMMGINAPKKDDSLYHAYLNVTDYISGMTDNYATFLAKQIGGHGA